MSIRFVLAVVIIAALPACKKGAEEGGSAAAAKAATPEDVARSYLELGAKGDLTRIKDLVDPKCYETPVGEVDAVRMLGARMTVSGIELDVKAKTDTTVEIAATVKGSIHAKDASGETTILGKPAKVSVSSMDVDSLSQTNTLHLIKQGERWVVTCP